MRTFGSAALVLLACMSFGGCDDAPPRNSYAWLDVGSPVALARAPDGEFVIAGDFGIFRTSGGEVDRVSSQGARGLVTAGDTCWFFGTDLRRMPLSGGALEVVYPGASAWGWAVDATHAYWLEDDGQGADAVLWRIPIDGGAREHVADLTNVWGRLAADDTHLYWITLRGIARMPKAGGTPEEIVVEADWQPYVDKHPSSLVVAGDFVYFASGQGYVGYRGGVLRANRDGSNVTLIAADQPQARELMVDATHVYWVRGLPNRYVEYPGEEDIVRMPLAGGPEEVIAQRQNGAVGLVSYSDGLYWASWLGNSLGFAPL